MTRQELIKTDSRKVRNNERLMAFYLQEFEKVFGRKPNCAGCTFKNDWKKFTKKVNQQKTTKSLEIMSTKKSFKIQPKFKNTVFTYLEGGRPKRSYGFNMTEEFAKNLLSKGNKKQIEERKKAFAKLPGDIKEIAPSIPTGDGGMVLLSKATGAQLDAYAKENEINFGDASKVDEKREVIAKTF